MGGWLFCNGFQRLHLRRGRWMGCVRVSRDLRCKSGKLQCVSFIAFHFGCMMDHLQVFDA
jgi:hypothetical protein